MREALIPRTPHGVFMHSKIWWLPNLHKKQGFLNTQWFSYKESIEIHVIAMGGLACKGYGSLLTIAFRRLHSRAVWAHRFRVFGLHILSMTIGVINSKERSCKRSHFSKRYQ